MLCCWYGGSKTTPWSQAWGLGSSVSAWWLDPAQRSDARPSAPGAATCRKNHERRVHRELGSNQGWRQPDPWTIKLALGMCHVTSLMGKETELVSVVEWYQLEIICLTSTFSLDGRTQLLERLIWRCLLGEAEGGVGSACLSPAVLSCVEDVVFFMN